jgi:TonB family protein
MTIYNIASWMAQIALLIAIAGLAALALRSQPRARLIFWQSTLALALLLPLLQPWPAVHEDSSAITITTGTVTIPAAQSSGWHFQWSIEYLLWIAAAGAAVRLTWIATGLWRLRRHRLAGRRFPNPPVPFEREQVAWFLSETVSGPVTFGWRSPAILLPARFTAMPLDLQEAVACHELIHVERRDWLFVIAEEIVRAAFWFHPAIWFAISQIQLAREQVVDLEVIRLTRDRDRYLDALLAVAEQKFQPDVLPATLFLTKRHLATRVAAILKETRMSKSRIAAVLTTASSAALLAARLAVWFFPLHSSAQTVTIPDSPGVTVNAGAALIHRAPVSRPGDGTASGTVVLDATLDSKGEVTDARVISGPDELRRAAIESVLQWHYVNDPLPPSPVRVSIEFSPDPNGVKGGIGSGVRGGISTGIGKGVGSGIANTTPATLKSIDITGVPPEIAEKVRVVLPFHEGDQIQRDAAPKMIAAARSVDEHFTGGLSINANHDATMHLRLQAPIFGNVPAADAAVTGAPPQRIRVGGNVQQANLITKVTPLYPPDAKAARIQGIVQLSVVIGKDGIVQNVSVMSGPALLVPAAVEAVQQWIYKPTLLNGNPVEVITQVDVNFTLTQ